MADQQPKVSGAQQFTAIVVVLAVLSTGYFAFQLCVAETKADLEHYRFTALLSIVAVFISGGVLKANDPKDKDKK